MFMHDRSRIPCSPRTNADQTLPLPVIPAHAAALILASALRSSKRRCFFNRRTLNRSKSVRDWRRSCFSCFFAQLVSAHLESISAFSQAALTAPVRAPRGSFSIVSGVIRVLAKETMLRGVASLGSADGPSTRACDASCFSFPTFLQSPERSTYALVVDDLDDDSEAASLQLQDAANLDVAPRAGSDLDFCHFVDFLNVSSD